MPINRGSDNYLLEVALETTDIGGTTAMSASVDMSECDDVMFVVEVGTWNVADDLLCQAYQDVQADMLSADVKVLGSERTHTDAADGQRYCHQYKAEDMDTEGVGTNTGLHFRYVALQVEEEDDTGVDQVTVVSLAFNLRKRYENRATYDAVDASS
jgi:hypothetical protein